MMFSKRMVAARAIAVVLSAGSILGGGRISPSGFGSNAAVCYADDVITVTDWKGLKENVEKKGGTIQLNKNIQCESSLTIPADKTVKLLLNGKNITYTNAYNNSIIVKGSLTIDGNGNTNSAVNVTEKGVFNLNDGQLIRVSLSDSAKMIMSGGTICESEEAGVTLNDSSVFKMSNGTITKNALQGVLLSSNQSTFTMSGGSVSENKREGVRSSGTFTMTGGRITENKGGGLSTNSSGSFKMSNKPWITGNTSGGKTQNISLYTGAKIDVTGEIKSGAILGIYTDSEKDITKNYSNYNSTMNPANCFSSDVDTYTISKNTANGEVQIKKKSSSSSSSSTKNSYIYSYDDDDDEKDEKISFSKGGIKTVGTGASKAVYSKNGDSSVCYEMPSVDEKTTSIRIPDAVSIKGKEYKVTEIAYGAFSDETKIKFILVGKNVKKIGEKAFNGAKSLRVLNIESKKLTKSKVKKSLLGSKIKTIYAPKNKVEEYSNIFMRSNSGKRVTVNPR